MVGEVDYSILSCFNLKTVQIAYENEVYDFKEWYASFKIYKKYDSLLNFWIIHFLNFISLNL